MAEFDLIRIMAQRCALARTDVTLGIGDDAAIVSVPADHELVICTDTLVAGVHFPLDTTPADIGWKSLAVNLSDLAAMGATPAWAVLALTLATPDREFVAQFADGFAELAAHYHVALIGGDTTRGPLTITVTVHGFVPPGQALRRDGASAGDLVFVSGPLGDAAAGLRCLNAHDPWAAKLRAAPEVDRDALIARLNRPQPAVIVGLALRGLASACIDISDGLLADLGHIAARSKVGIEIDVECLPASAALLALFDEVERHTLQLTGGDDYQLAFTVAPEQVDSMKQKLSRIGAAATCIGRIIEGSGVRVLDGNGEEKVMSQRGWEHFA